MKFQEMLWFTGQLSEGKQTLISVTALMMSFPVSLIFIPLDLHIEEPNWKAKALCHFAKHVLHNSPMWYWYIVSSAPVGVIPPKTYIWFPKVTAEWAAQPAGAAPMGLSCCHFMSPAERVLAQVVSNLSNAVCKSITQGHSLGALERWQSKV